MSETIVAAQVARIENWSAICPVCNKPAFRKRGGRSLHFDDETKSCDHFAYWFSGDPEYGLPMYGAVFGETAEDAAKLLEEMKAESEKGDDSQSRGAV